MAAYADDDFVKTVLNWPLEIFRAPLEIAIDQVPLPQMEVNVKQYYNNFLPFILEEARAIIAAGLEKIELLEKTQKYGKKKQKQKVSQDSLKLNEARAFQLVLKQEPRYPKNDGNPLSMRFVGAIPDEIEHGASMNVLLLKIRDKGLPEKKILALASENFNDARELFVKIIIPWEDYADYQNCFTEKARWSAHYLGSVISESRMYEACRIATDSLCVRQIARSMLPEPRFAVAFRERAQIPTLNLSQQKAVWAFLSAENGSVLLLQGPPGTGKTTTLVHLLKQVSLLQKRILVSAHSNKGVQVLASRAMEKLPDTPMVLVGVESKVPEALKPLFLDRWHEMIADHLSVDSCPLLEILAQGEFSKVKIPLHKILSDMSLHLKIAQEELNKFKLILNKAENGVNRNSPFSKQDFENVQALITKTEKEPYQPENWQNLLNQYITLQKKWRGVHKESLKKHLLNYAHVVFVTLISSGRESLLEMNDIDFLLVDEAAQSVEAATLVPMRYGPKKVLLVGDTKQLPATVISEILDDNLAPRKLKHYKRSMMWRLIEENQQPNLMLTTQYRMHPHICQWPSMQYYSDRLITDPDILPMSPLSKRGITSRPYAIYQVQGSVVEEGHSICNHEEATYVVNIVRLIQAETKGSERSIGVITPYVAQKRLIMEKLKQGRNDLNRVDVNTVDGFQGDERDVIIISFARTHVSKFLEEFRRLNVAITRPKFCLIILGSPKLVSGDIAELIQDANKRGVLYSQFELTSILNSRQVLEEKQYNSAKMDLEARAWKGDAEDQFLYAKDIERADKQLSMTWIRRAAENGHSEAQYCMSQFYCSAVSGETKDVFLSASWLQKSAWQGFAPAQHTFGANLLSGTIFAQNIQLGISWCERAAVQDFLEAILLLARHYEEGRIVLKNEMQAIQYYRQAAELNCEEGMLRLAELLSGGHEKNKREAVKWYRELAERKRPNAYYPLAHLLANVLNQQNEALRWYLKAADSGHVEAQYEVGLRFKEGSYGCTVDRDKATFYFKKAAIGGHLEGQFSYALCLKESMRVAQDRIDATHFFKMAADRGHIEAQYQYAQLKEKDSPQDASRYYKKAADSRHIEAQYRFAMLQEKIAPQIAYEYYKKAATKNHKLAQYACIRYQLKYQCDLEQCLYFCELLQNEKDFSFQFVLARLLDSGIAGKTDKKTAYSCYEIASKRGHQLALYYMAVLLEQGVELEIERNINLAIEYYRACPSDYFYARLRLAFLLLENKDPNSEIEIQKLLKSYCEEYVDNKYRFLHGIEQSLEKAIDRKFNKVDREEKAIQTNCVEIHFYLGIIFEKGKGVKIDVERALFHYQCAALSIPDADYRMGYIYEFGEGGRVRDVATARVYYQRAADKGYEPAAERLSWTYAFFSTFSDIPDEALSANKAPGANGTPSATQEKNCLVM